MPRSCRMVLRTAASTSTARLRPASTAITVLRTGHVEDLLVQRLVGQALEVAVHGRLAHQVDDQLQPHLPSHRGLAEDRLDVEQADAAHLEQVHQQLRAAALEGGLRDTVEVDRVVGHEAVAARNQLQPELALAEAGFAGEQHAEAQDVHEDAVAGGALGEVLAEVAADQIDHVAGRFAGDEQRDVGPVAQGDQAVGRHLGVGADQHRRLERDDARDPPVGHLAGGVVEVGDLAPADDLHPVRVDVVQVADQVGGGAGVADRRFVEMALRMGMAGDPLPVQGRPELLEQRLGADDGGLHDARFGLTRPSAAAPRQRSGGAPRRRRPRS